MVFHDNASRLLSRYYTLIKISIFDEQTLLQLISRSCKFSFHFFGNYESFKTPIYTFLSISIKANLKQCDLSR